MIFNLSRIRRKANRKVYNLQESGGVVVTTSASGDGGTGSIPGTGSCDIKIWLSTLGTLMSVPSQFGT